MTTKYSVIIPVYNSEKTILKLLNSISLLEIQPSEIIVINDGSTDRTSEIIKMQEGINLVELKQNFGPARARNEGAKIAKSPWLLFIDSDCSLSPSSIKYAFPDSEEEKNNIVGVMCVFSSQMINSSITSNYKNIQRHFEIKNMNNPPNVFSSSCFTISRDAFSKSGGFNESFGKIPTEDNEFYFRLLKNNFWIKFNVAFSFFHHKKMSIKNLFSDDFSRAKAIILNMFGYLGEKRDGLELRETIRWSSEILFGLFFLSNLLIIPVYFFIFPFKKFLISLFCLIFSFLIIFLINFKFFKYSFISGGYKLFISHFLLRNFEMLTAFLSISYGILEVVLKHSESWS